MGSHEPTTIDHKGQLKYQLNDHGDSITIGLFEVFNSLDEDQKLRVAEALTWGPVLDQAIRRLTDSSPDWYAGDDCRLSFEVVEKMVHASVGRFTYYGKLWQSLRQVRDACVLSGVNTDLFAILINDWSPITQEMVGRRFSDVFDEVVEKHKCRGRSFFASSVHGEFVASLEKTVAAAVKSVDDYLPLIKAAERISDLVAAKDATRTERDPDDWQWAELMGDDAEVVDLRAALKQLKETPCSTTSPQS